MVSWPTFLASSAERRGRAGMVEFLLVHDSGRWIGDLSARPKEREVLFPRHSSFLVVADGLGPLGPIFVLREAHFPDRPADHAGSPQVQTLPDGREVRLANGLAADVAAAFHEILTAAMTAAVPGYDDWTDEEIEAWQDKQQSAGLPDIRWR